MISFLKSSSLSLFNNAIRNVLLGAIILFMTSCSYIFPKQFENFPSVEELENSAEQTSDSAKASNSKNSKPEKKSQKDSNAEQNKRANNKKNPSKNQIQNSSINAEITPLTGFRKQIEIALENPSSKLKIQTPQAIILHYQGKTQKRRDGNLDLVACGNSVCLDGSFSNTKLADSIEIEPKYDFLEWNGNPYRGVFVVKNIQEKLVLINSLPMEDYLKGVLPYEIGVLGEWAYEALKSQAVAARTYTYNYLDRRRKQGFDLYADTRDQMYLGVSKEYPLSNQAIQETEDLIMTYQEKPIEAYYHSTCGGYTADISQVWSSKPIEYLQSRSDLDENGEAYCKKSSLFEWKYDFSSAEWNKNISKNAQKSSSEIRSNIQSPILKITSRTPEGRVQSAEIRHSKGQTTIPGDKVRWLFNPPGGRLSILPSSWVEFDHQNGTWHLEGKGFGHGIGLCQMGARERSRAGQNFQQILQAYYSNISFKKVQ